MILVAHRVTTNLFSHHELLISDFSEEQREERACEEWCADET